MAYRITDKAVRQAKACGLSGDVRGRLSSMLEASVPDTALAGNRGYGPFVFAVSGDLLLTVEKRGPRFSASQPTSVCALCDGALLRTTIQWVNGVRAPVTRPCPRSVDPSLPRCDLAVANRDPKR